MEQQDANVIDTFDDGPYTDGPMEEETSGQEAAAEEQSTEEVPEQTEAKEEIDPDSQVNMLDNTEEKAEEETPKEPEGDREGDSDEQEAKSDEKSSTPEATDDTAEEVRNLKAFRDGKQYEIPEDAELKVKVKGKWEKVPLTELRDNYAGKVAYDEKFQALNEDLKQFESERNQYQESLGDLKQDLVQVARLVKGALDGNNSPTEGMEYLLDLMGGNALQYKKAMFEYMADQLDVYSQMDEYQREAYWVKQENEYLTKQQESLKARSSEERAQVELQQNIRQLRETHGISEDAYNSAREALELGGANHEDMTPENIVQAARLTPLLLEAERLLDPYKDKMDDDDEFTAMSVEIAKTMFESPDLPIETIQNLIAEQYEVEEIVSTLVQKTGKEEGKEAARPAPPSNHLESFDDFDY
jgi:hypothetical protein